MYLSHVFRTYFEGNKNASPGSDQILKTPLGSEKVLPNYRFLSKGQSGMRFKMDYPPTLTLVASILLFLPSLSCFHSHSWCLMAYTCQQSGHGTAVTKCVQARAGSPRVRSHCSAYSTQSNSLPPHLSKPTLSGSSSISRPVCFF